MESHNLPKHVAIIMDGNGRWAKAQGQPRYYGHQRGVETAERIIEAASDLHISYLTLYAFSEENWQRPDDEIATIMGLLKLYLESRQEKLLKNGVRFETIGNLSRLPVDVQQVIAETKQKTAGQSKLTLILALSYGARDEILRAVNRLVQERKATDKAVTESDFEQVLDTKNFPDPDLFIRTSGEYRISNYLLWQMAYTELYFSKKMWPEFTAEDLKVALQEFARRERRFGKVGAPS